MIGDSYVSGLGSPALQPALAKIFPSASSFRNFATAGTSLATGGITGFIPSQLAAAVTAGPDIRLVIMDGGLNDLVICDSARFPNCSTACKGAGSSSATVCTSIVDAARSAFNQLLGDMTNQGVSDLIYFLPPHFPGSNSGFNEILDFMAVPFATDCASAATRSGGRLVCHFVDLRPAYAAAGGDMNPANFATDSMHPSDAGQTISATAIANVMKTACLGQTSGSGCCRP